LFEGDAVYKRYLRGLRDICLFIKNISGINCEHWDALQLVSALKLLLFPEEEIDFPEVKSYTLYSTCSFHGSLYPCNV
jgi:hypothetical protein